MVCSCSKFLDIYLQDIYLQGMRDRSMRSGTELAREIKLTDWSMAGNMSNRSSGVQIPCDISNRLKRYLYSAKCSWIIKFCLLKLIHEWFILTGCFAKFEPLRSLQNFPFYFGTVCRVKFFYVHKKRSVRFSCSLHITQDYHEALIHL